MKHLTHYLRNYLVTTLFCHT